MQEQKEQKKSIAILDANAFISMSSILHLTTQYRIITTEDVLGELKDAKTKQFVESLPYEIQTMQADEKAIEKVKEFAKKTGDIASLSQIDMELIAVAEMVYRKEGMEGLLRKEPPPIFEKDDLLDIADKEELSSSEYESSSEQETHLEAVKQTVQQLRDSTHEKINSSQKIETINSDQKEKQQKSGSQGEKVNEDDGWVTVPVKPKKKVISSSSESDDEQGWITTKNYEKKMAQMTSSFNEDEQDKNIFNIWLVSADFALQNVAVQMGIKLLSLDGRKISSIRRFIYECYLCWKKYRIYDEKVRLCKNCGYNSLSKIAYSIDDKGCMVLHRKKGWKPNAKILEAKQRKFQEQERKKKHQHARRKKKPSIFQK